MPLVQGVLDQEAGGDQKGQADGESGRQDHDTADVRREGEAARELDRVQVIHETRFGMNAPKSGPRDRRDPYRTIVRVREWIP